VAFTFGRAFGPAVSRNRVRRRLRAILRELDRRDPLPPGSLLFGGRPSLSEQTFDQLTATVSSIVAELRTITPASSR
jgi:ribonuclease P protein component